jgi:hypothetical protein
MQAHQVSNPKRQSRHNVASPAKWLGFPKILLVSIMGRVCSPGGGAVMLQQTGWARNPVKLNNLHLCFLLSMQAILAKGA